MKDIQLSVKYAKENDLGIAVRTGGHQYSGASSASGNIIQLDLSDTFTNIYSDFRYNFKTGLLRCGVSFGLHEFTQMLRNMKMFVPHGQCLGVHIGGHVQTGGYGMVLRAFGLLSDHVEGVEMVMADGELKRIWKPQGSGDIPKNLTKEDDELFWAVMGGSVVL